MSLLPLLAAGTSTSSSGVTMPEPTVPPIPVEQRVGLDVLTNKTSTDIVRGATLTFPPASRRASPLPNPARWWNWGDAFWETWPIETWIAPSIDHMAAHGANVVAFKGGDYVVANGRITWDEYLRRWVETINYCKGLGVRCFVAFSDPTDTGGTYNHAQRDRAREWAAAIATTGNVIGVDVINEVWNGPYAPYVNIELIAAVKESGLPATFDTYLHVDPADGQTKAFEPVGYYRDMDFLAFHTYADVPGTSAWVQAWLDTKTDAASFGPKDRRWIWGEFGIEATATGSAKIARYSGMRNLIESDPRHAGACAFSWTDFVDHDNPVAPDEANIPYWGLHSVNNDRTLTARPGGRDTWQTWPVRRS